MSIEVVFPEVSKNNPKTQGVVATWFVSDHDQVSQGQLLAEVQVDKIDVEVHSPSDGIIKIIAEEGTELTQLDVIAYID